MDICSLIITLVQIYTVASICPQCMCEHMNPSLLVSIDFVYLFMIATRLPSTHFGILPINPFPDLPCLYICINCSSSPCFYSYIQRFVCQFDAYLLVSYILLYKSVWMSLLWLYMYMNQFATIGLITHIQAWMSLMLWVSTICVYKSTCCHGFDCMYLNQFAAPILITYNYIYEFSLVWSNPYIYKLLIPMHMRFLWSLMWLYI